MKRFFPAFFLIVIVLAVYPFLDDEGAAKKLSGLPWQIAHDADGFTRVFGISPGRSTLADAAAVLGEDYELALVQKGDALALEMYFGHYRAGLLSAKMVLAARVDEAVLQRWRERVVKTDYMGDGKAKKLFLHADDMKPALASVIDSIAFIPAVNLDDTVIRQRFGEPAQVLAAAGGVTHYLYPRKGLAIALSASVKEVLQYVAPADFERLRRPLAGGGEAIPEN